MSGVIILTVIALLLGIVLTVVNLYLKEDNKIPQIVSLLPGFNCGACTFPGCQGMAENSLKDISALDRCRALKKENKDRIIEIINNG